MESNSRDKNLQWIWEKIAQWWRTNEEEVVTDLHIKDNYFSRWLEMVLKCNGYCKWDLTWCTILNYGCKMTLIWTLLWTKMNSWLILTFVCGNRVCTPGSDLCASLRSQVSHAKLFSPILFFQMRCVKSRCKLSVAEAVWKGKLLRPVQRCTLYASLFGTSAKHLRSLRE